MTRAANGMRHVSPSLVLWTEDMNNNRRIEVIAIIKSQREAGGPVTVESVQADLAVLDAVAGTAPAAPAPAQPARPASSRPVPDPDPPANPNSGPIQYVLRKVWDNRNEPGKKPNVRVVLVDEMGNDHKVTLFDRLDQANAAEATEGVNVVCEVTKKGQWLNGRRFSVVGAVQDRQHATGAVHAQGQGQANFPADEIPW